MNLCSRCEGLGLIRATCVVPAHVYGTAREVQVTKPCPRCGGTGKATVLTTQSMWWLDKDEESQKGTL